MRQAHLAVNEVVGEKGKNTGWNSRGNARVFFLVYITLEDGNEESKELGPLGPHMGYRWNRLSPRITKIMDTFSRTGSNWFYDWFVVFRFGTFCSIMAHPGQLQE